MAIDEPLVTIDEIQLEAKWAVDVRANGVVVSDWAGRAAVPVSVAAELFERACAEGDRLAVEPHERHAAVAAKGRRRPGRSRVVVSPASPTRA